METRARITGNASRRSKMMKRIAQLRHRLGGRNEVFITSGSKTQPANTNTASTMENCKELIRAMLSTHLRQH